MTTLYAQSTGNWDAINWNTAANGSGSNQTPAAGDTLVSNTYTVTVNGNYTAARVTNTLGGTFTLSNGVTLTCTDGTAGILGAFASVGAVTSSLTTGQSASIVGIVSGNIPGPSQNLAYGVVINGVGGTLNITGNVLGGGRDYCYGVLISAAHSLNVTGNVVGGYACSEVRGIHCAAVANITITGSVSGGSVTTGANHGISLVSSATLNISGSVTGGGGSGGAVNIGSGIVNSAASTITIGGNVTGGTVAIAVGLNNSNASAVIQISGNVSASDKCPALVNSVAGSAITIGGNIVNYVTNSGAEISHPAIYSLSGIRLAAGFSPIYLQVANHDCSGTVKFFTANHPDSDSNMPVIANVRYGTTYGPSGEFTGTCRIPAASSVAYGAMVDDTTGTAVLTAEAVTAAVWDTLVADLDTANSIGARLAQAATVPSTGAQIAALGV